MNPGSFFFASKKSYRELRRVTALCCVILPFQTARPAPAAKISLAKVAILPYVDRTGTSNFKYLSASLTEAVENSLKQKFEFVPAEGAAVRKAAARLGKEKPAFNAALASQLQAVSQSDILIFGYISHNVAENQIIIHTHVSIAAGNYFSSLPKVANAVDATLFRAADNVAADILSELAAIAQAQQKNLAQGNAKKVSNKLLLTRDAVRNDWARYTWLVGGSVFAFLRLPDHPGQDISMRPGFSVNAERAFWKNFFVDVGLGFLPLKTKIGEAGTVLTLNALDATLGVTYHYPFFGRWELAAGASAGFFYGKYEKTAACGLAQCNSSAGTAGNPAFAIRMAVNYLIFRNYALGMEGRWTMLADSPDSLQLFSLGFKVQYLW